jgi:hypothetical protein
MTRSLTSATSMFGCFTQSKASSNGSLQGLALQAAGCHCRGTQVIGIAWRLPRRSSAGSAGRCACWHCGEATTSPPMHERDANVVCITRSRCGLLLPRGRRRAPLERFCDSDDNDDDGDGDDRQRACGVGPQTFTRWRWGRGAAAAAFSGLVALLPTFGWISERTPSL